MKMSLIKINEIYAVKRGSFSKRPATNSVEGFEGFNPFCVQAKIVKKDVTKRVGFDYEAGQQKTRKGFVDVLFAARDGSFDSKYAYRATIPTSNIVSTWAEYQVVYKKWGLAIEKKRNEDKKAQETAQKHLNKLILELRKGAKLEAKRYSIDSYIPHGVRKVTVEEYLAASHISLDYKTAMALAELVMGRKLDLPVLS